MAAGLFVPEKILSLTYLLNCVCVSDLPEWSTVGVDDVAYFGTFDASGAFMSKDVSLNTFLFFVIF